MSFTTSVHQAFPVLLCKDYFEERLRDLGNSNQGLKPLQDKKGQKNLGYPRKKQSFYKEKDCFFSKALERLLG